MSTDDGLKRLFAELGVIEALEAKMTNLREALAGAAHREADLKARLREVRQWVLAVNSESERADDALRATDLRVRNWRKP